MTLLNTPQFDSTCTQKLTEPEAVGCRPTGETLASLRVQAMAPLVAFTVGCWLSVQPLRPTVGVLRHSALR